MLQQRNPLVGHSLRTLTISALITVLLVACSQKPVAYIDVPTTLPMRIVPPTTRAAPGLRPQIPPVEGSTTSTSISFAKGKASISGTVIGPDGPVPGATVELVRIIGNIRSSPLRLVTNEDGKYSATGIKGGVVEIYAFKSPSFSMGDSITFFAGAGAKQDVTVKRFDGPDLKWSLGPAQPYVGRTVTLSVRVAVQQVTPDGIVVPTFLEGIGVRVVPLGSLQPVGEFEKVSNVDGLASFTLSCSSTGPGTLQLLLATGEEATIEPRACIPPPTTQPPSTLPSDDAADLDAPAPDVDVEPGADAGVGDPVPVEPTPVPATTLAPAVA
jgi:hypothetical protein